jgi:hypothetical protein
VMIMEGIQRLMMTEEILVVIINNFETTLFCTPFHFELL